MQQVWGVQVERGGELAARGAGAAAISRLFQQSYRSRAAVRIERAQPQANEPLEAVEGYAAGDHWHFVSYGLSNTGGEALDSGSFAFEDGLSGFGFELTFRLARTSSVAPTWPARLLQYLARYVFQSANVLRPGDHLMLPAGLLPEGSQVRALVLAADPTCAPVETANGSVSFVQVVGVTNDELAAIKSWRCGGFLELLSRYNPWLQTDLFRSSYLLDDRFRSVCELGAAIEGSAQSEAMVTLAFWEQPHSDALELTIGAGAVNDLLCALRGRLPFNRDFVMRSRRATIRLRPGLEARWARQGPELVIEVPWDAAAKMLATLEPKRGRYSWPSLPGLAITVRPTHQRDQRGQMIRIIG